VKKTLAWHFLPGDGTKLENTGKPVPPDGEWLEESGPPVLCTWGLHASVDILDALKYASGSVICRVELGGEIVRGNDKLCATRRRILWRLDAAEVLRAFARKCALDVVRLWDAPEVVLRYLRTGDESIRVEARSAAWSAAVAWSAASAETAAVVSAAEWASASASAASAAGSVEWATVAWSAASGAVLSGAAVRDKQNRRLTRMILAAHKKEIGK